MCLFVFASLLLANKWGMKALRNQQCIMGGYLIGPIWKQNRAYHDSIMMINNNYKHIIPWRCNEGIAWQKDRHTLQYIVHGIHSSRLVSSNGLLILNAIKKFTQQQCNKEKIINNFLFLLQTQVKWALTFKFTKCIHIHCSFRKPCD